MKRIQTLLLFLAAITIMTAQTKKSFTLDDLMWGGQNYWNIQPRSLYTEWWGDRLVKLNQIAIQQMQVLEGNSGRILLK